MKSGLLVVAAATIVAGVSAEKHARHFHDIFHNLERALKVSSAPSPQETCEATCTTVYTTITGEGTRMSPIFNN